MVVCGASLVDNASQRLFQYGIDHGCMQANHWNRKPKHPLQVCSVDTLYRRKTAPQADLVVIDEAHYAGSPSFRWLIEQYPDTYMLGVTATPHVKHGLRHLADHVVYPISILDLMEQGYLVKPRYFAPSRIDLSRVREDAKTGDYNMADLGAALDEQVSLFGDVVAAYRKYLGGKPAVCFAVSKEHSKRLCDLFNQSGYCAVHVEDSTSMKERAEVIKGLEDGSINVVTNVGIFTVGVDIPCLRGVISVRPTKSYNLWIQQCGRGTRPYPGKSDFVVLDHANNISEHGFIESEMPCDLDGKPKREGAGPMPRICEQCFGAFMKEDDDITCPHCGFVNRKAGAVERKRKIEADVRNYELKEITAERQLEIDIDRWIHVALIKGYKTGWIYFQLEKKYGEKTAKRLWPGIKKKAARSASA